MAIYIFNIISILIYRLLIKNDKRFCKVAAFQMFLILALRREDIGGDLGGYKYVYNTVATWSWNDLVTNFRVFSRFNITGIVNGESSNIATEGGYLVINWLLNHVGITFHGFLIILSALYMYSFGKFVEKYSQNILTSFILFIGFTGYQYCFGLLRYWMAVSIFLLSIHFLEENRKVHFIIIVIATFFVYRSMIIYLPLLYFYNKKIRKRQLAGVGFSWIILLIASQWLYSKYLSSIMAHFGNVLMGEFRWNKMIILMFLTYFLIYGLVDSRVFEKPINRITMWCFLLSVYIEILGMNNDTFARLIWMLFIGVVVLIPNLIEEYKDVRIRQFALIAIYLMMFAMMLLTYENYNIVPYRFFWE